jgi:transposase
VRGEVGRGECVEVDDELWELAESLIAPVKSPAHQGQRPVPDRVAFNAILFVLVTGITWRYLPREMGCSGVTVWRGLRDWQAAGVWEQLHALLVGRLNGVGAIDWSASVMDDA